MASYRQSLRDLVLHKREQYAEGKVISHETPHYVLMKRNCEEVDKSLGGQQGRRECVCVGGGRGDTVYPGPQLERGLLKCLSFEFCWEHMTVDESTWHLMRVHKSWWEYMTFDENWLEYNESLWQYIIVGDSCLIPFHIFSTEFLAF